MAAVGFEAQASVRASQRTRPERARGRWMLATVPAVTLAIVAALLTDAPSAIEIVGSVLIVAWAVAGAVLVTRRPTERFGVLVLAGATIAGIGALCGAVDQRSAPVGAAGVAVDLGVRLAATLLPAVAFHLLLSLPDGVLATRGRRRAMAAAYLLAIVVGVVLMTDRDHVTVWPIVLLWLVALLAGLAAAHSRYRAAGARDRHRMQWVGWALAVGAEAVLVVVALHALTGRPADLAAWAVAVTGVVPVALIASTTTRAVNRIDRLLAHTVSIAGLTALIIVVYSVVLLALGRRPEESERSLLLLSMGAAAVAALLWLPARRWLADAANRVVYGERVAPDEALRTWGSRLTRAIPLDELLLQLCESLRKSMNLAAAEVWTGQDGHFEWATGVPHRAPPPLEIGTTEQPVVARAGVSGGTWLEIWLPTILGSSPSAAVRVAPLAHQGELLGLIVARRADDGEAFRDEDDRVLGELARQVGLALHNMQLDSALQASLGELRRANNELRASRARIVVAGDAERRRIERNLHDGAQQHLVALAIKLRLAKDAVDDDPPGAIELIDELRADLQDAIQELRALAHGIFPPLLISGGLAEALPAAASRAALATTVDASGLRRYPDGVEAAVYFCCLEALQNAGKHAGEGAQAIVHVWETDGELRFEVADDGVGFDPSGVVNRGHGFVNMADRLGAIGGTLEVKAAHGHGTTIGGRLPVASAAHD